GTGRPTVTAPGDADAAIRHRHRNDRVFRRNQCSERAVRPPGSQQHHGAVHDKWFPATLVDFSGGTNIIARVRHSPAAVYAQVLGVSFTYVAMIAGFSYQIARAAGIA